MDHIEFIDGKPIKIKQVEISGGAIKELYREMGINAVVQPRNRPIKRQSKAQEPYVRTIPLPWIQQAFRLPGKSLHVGIVLWYLAGVSKSLTVKLTRSWLRRFGLHPETGRRGLHALERAKLVHVERSGKKSPWVTLLTRSSKQPIKRLEQREFEWEARGGNGR